MKRFNTSFMGYEKGEVNNFVYDVTLRYEELLNKYKSANEKIEALSKELEKYKGIEETLSRALVVANETANVMRKNTKDEADMIISEAKRNASRIVNDALLKARKAEEDADRLRSSIDNYKRKIKLLMEEQEELMNNLKDIDF